MDDGAGTGVNRADRSERDYSDILTMERAMRDLDSEEKALLNALDRGATTAQLIEMVRDLGSVLRARGHVVQANVAELAADRLEALSNGRDATIVDRNPLSDGPEQSSE
jgi:hypothetical protein